MNRSHSSLSHCEQTLRSNHAPGTNLSAAVRRAFMVAISLICLAGVLTIFSFQSGEAREGYANSVPENIQPAALVISAQATPAAAAPSNETVSNSTLATATTPIVGNLDIKTLFSSGAQILVAIITAVIAVMTLLSKKFAALDKLTTDTLMRSSDAMSKAELAERASREAKVASVEAASQSRTACDLADEALKNIKKASKQIEALEDRFNDLEDLTHSSLRPVIRERAQKSSMKDIIEAFENGEISEEEYVEGQQLLNWRKWIYKRNQDGYRELVESARQDDGLTPPVRTLAREEILRLQEKERDPGGLSKSEQALKNLLVSLLKIKPG